jgi:hypothetical protein
MFIRVLYCIFLGLLVVLFVAWAMAAWFPTPQWDEVYHGFKQQDQPAIPPSSDELNLLSPEDKAARIQQFEADRVTYAEWQANHEQRDKEFQRMMDKQGTTVSLVSMLIAVVLTAVSLWYAGKLQVITEGLLMGGVFTLIYSLGWTFIHAQKIAVVTIGVSLVITIIIGYKKFVQKPNPTPPALEPPKP